MIVKFDETKTKVFFIHESGSEYKKLMDFPAFEKFGPYHYVPAKSHVLFNVVNRIKDNFKGKMKMEKEVLDLMNSDMKLRTLPESFRFFTKPMPYQEIALRYMYTVGSGGLLLDPGMGKSKVVLDYIALQGFKRVLLLCPLPLLFVWEDEVAAHRPDLTIHLVTTTNWDEEKAKAGDATIICMNYSKAVLMKDQLKKEQFDFIHLDEFLIKDPSTERTKAITALSKSIPYKCGGSGTLVNNSITDIFAPVRFLEPSLVGGNYRNFMDRHLYRNPKDKRQVLGHTKMPEAKSILESCCIVMTKSEWLKLPDKRFHEIIVQPSDEQREFYSSLSRNFIATLQGEVVEVDNALVMMSKLYQVSNGFFYASDPVDDSNEVVELLAEETKVRKKKAPRRTVFFEQQPKIAALDKLITETTKEKRAIIWFNMEAEYVLLKKFLDEKGLTYRAIKGGSKNLGATVREYNNDPSIQFLLCQAKSVNYGITILGTTMEKLEDANFEMFPGISPSVHTQIFYSCNFSLEVYLQQQDRIHRIGQTKDCDYYLLWLNTNVEMTIRKALVDKLFLRKEMLVDIAEKLRDTDIQESTEEVV